MWKNLSSGRKITISFAAWSDRQLVGRTKELYIPSAVFERLAACWTAELLLAVLATLIMRLLLLLYARAEWIKDAAVTENPSAVTAERTLL